MRNSTPWFIPALATLGIMALVGSAICLTLYFVISNKYEQLTYLAGFFIFGVTSFFSLGISKVTQNLLASEIKRR